MRYFCIVSYFGEAYKGWQSQNNKKGVEDKIEELFSSILDEKINVFGAGRTDKGVHAYGQTFHFDVSKKIANLGHFKYAVNRLLPKDIRIKEINLVNDDFHARFSAKSKEYIYKIYLGNNVPFYYKTHWVIYYKLDFDLLNEAEKIFIGKHNFQNLTSKEIDDKNFLREVYKIEHQIKGDEIIFTIVGNAFMRYMVRFIIGEIIQVASNKKPISELNKLFSSVRLISHHKAPAEGLYLNKVNYE